MDPRKPYNRNKEYNPVLQLANNTGADIGISLFRNTDFAAQSSFNSKQRYSWDITAETFAGAYSVSISAKWGSQPYQLYSALLPSPTAQSVVNVLNGFGIGLFYVIMAGGSTFIRTYNDRVQYSNLNINGTTTYLALKLSINLLFDDSTGIAGGCTVITTDVTQANQQILSLSGDNGGLSYPIVSSLDSQFAFLTAGDIIKIDINCASNPMAPLFSSLNMVLKQNGTTIFNSIMAGSIPGPLAPAITFAYVPGDQYDLAGTIKFL